MNDQQVEQAIEKLGLSAPRITQNHVEDTIVDEIYWNPPNTTLTVCALQLRNGTFVVGESACVSMENFNLDLGMGIARQNAKDKVWALEGYLLREQLSGGVTAVATLSSNTLQDEGPHPVGGATGYTDAEAAVQALG